MILMFAPINLFDTAASTPASSLPPDDRNAVGNEDTGIDIAVEVIVGDGDSDAALDKTVHNADFAVQIEFPWVNPVRRNSGLEVEHSLRKFELHIARQRQTLQADFGIEIADERFDGFQTRK